MKYGIKQPKRFNNKIYLNKNNEYRLKIELDEKGIFIRMLKNGNLQLYDRKGRIIVTEYLQKNNI